MGFAHMGSVPIEQSPARRRMLGGIGQGLAAAGLSWALAGCANLPQALSGRPGSESWKGRFALIVDAPVDSPINSPTGQAPAPSPGAALPASPQPGLQRSSGNFTLTQMGDVVELELRSPLGNTLAMARAEPQGAWLRTADGQRHEAPTADALTEQVFGWRIPVLALPRWLRGEPAEVLTRTTSPDGRTRPASAREDGWQLDYEDWGARQPRRLNIAYPARLRLRLVLDETPGDA